MLSSSEFLHHNFQSGIELKKVVSSENLTFYKGFGMSSIYSGAGCLTKNLHLIVFKKLPNSFDIDFISQDLNVGAIYVIPPDHMYFISMNSNCEYYCFDISLSIIDNRFIQFINAIGYQKQKNAHLYNKVDFLKRLENWDSTTTAIQIIEFIKQGISKATTQNSCLPEQFFLANHFLKFLLNSEIDITHSIKQYSEMNGCCTRSLQRACLINFKVSPKEMLKHHLFIKSIKLLSIQNNSIQNIASSLGYSNYNAFCKFTKTHIDLTPKEIKRQLIGSKYIL
jgi:AraC-like DNA-binding protein